MKKLLILALLVVLVVDIALAEGDDDQRPAGRRGRNRDRSRGKSGRRQKSRGCKYERLETKLKDLCESADPIQRTVNLNTTARNDANCAPTKVVSFNCAKVCKYENTGERARCDRQTQTRSITLTLKAGMPSWCAPTSTKTKPCGRRNRKTERTNN